MTSEDSFLEARSEDPYVHINPEVVDPPVTMMDPNWEAAERERLRVVAMEYSSKVSGENVWLLLKNADRIWAWLKTGQVAENDGPADSQPL